MRRRAVVSVAALLGGILLMAGESLAQRAEGRPGLSSFPAAVSTEEAENTSTNDTLTLGSLLGGRAISFRVNVLSWQIRDRREKGWGAKLNAKAEATLYEFDTVDALLSPDTEKIQTITLKPKLSLDFPLEKTQHFLFVPNAELGITYDRTRADVLVSGVGRLALTYYEPGEFESLQVSLVGAYGTRYAEDAQNLTDFFSIALEGNTKHYLGFEIGKYLFIMTPHAKLEYFIDDLTLSDLEGHELDLKYRAEVGLKVGTQPRYRIWKLKIPRIKVSYSFGEDYSKFKIGLGG
jgi:hypothetical protein